MSSGTDPYQELTLQPADMKKAPAGAPFLHLMGPKAYCVPVELEFAPLATPAATTTNDRAATVPATPKPPRPAPTAAWVDRISRSSPAVFRSDAIAEVEKAAIVAAAIISFFMEHSFSGHALSNTDLQQLSEVKKVLLRYLPQQGQVICNSDKKFRSPARHRHGLRPALHPVQVLNKKCRTSPSLTT